MNLILIAININFNNQNQNEILPHDILTMLIILKIA